MSTVVIVVIALAVLLVALGGFVVVGRSRRGRVGPDAAPPAVRPASGRPGAPPPTAPPKAPAKTPAKAQAPAWAPPSRGLGDRIRSLFGAGVSDQTWKDLEGTLIRADVGPRGASDVVERVRSAYSPPQDPAQVVAAQVAAVFDGDAAWTPPEAPGGGPAVVMVVGVNGTGKTTSIGKLAKMIRSEGKSVAMAASDTFRAAAGEQLETWAQRSGASLVAQGRGADPGAVAFDAYGSAKAKGTDVLLVDTAGRLHTKNPLMEELKKVRRVLERAAGHPPDEVLLVLDATTGQNGIAQARAFTDAVDVSGVILTKMDGSARGGVVVAVREELGVPVKLIGTGEGIDDLSPFDPEDFARRLLS
jgi:fused signal recognition particle receptor